MRLPSTKNRKVISLYLNPDVLKSFKLACKEKKIKYGDSLEKIIIKLTKDILGGKQ